jgi:uncharacterized protein (TIGR02757 family)
MKLIEIKDFLDGKVMEFNQPAFIKTDPIQVPRKFTLKEDIEIAGFLAATIAWGNRTSIIKNAERLMNLMDNQPHDFILNSSTSETNQLKRFVHRTFNGEDCIYFVKALKNIYRNHDGLQTVFEKGFQHEHSVKSALAWFYEIFFECTGERTRKHISNVQKGSSGKRLNIFCRLIKVA